MIPKRCMYHAPPMNCSRRPLFGPTSLTACMHASCPAQALSPAGLVCKRGGLKLHVSSLCPCPLPFGLALLCVNACSKAGTHTRPHIRACAMPRQGSPSPLLSCELPQPSRQPAALWRCMLVPRTSAERGWRSATCMHARRHAAQLACQQSAGAAARGSSRRHACSFGHVLLRLGDPLLASAQPANVWRWRATH